MTEPPLNPCLTDEDRGLIERVLGDFVAAGLVAGHPAALDDGDVARLLAAAREADRLTIQASLGADEIYTASQGSPVPAERWAEVRIRFSGEGAVQRAHAAYGIMKAQEDDNALGV